MLVPFAPAASRTVTPAGGAGSAGGAFTVTVNVSVEVPPNESATGTVMTEEPVPPAFGATTNVRFVPLPLRVIPLSGTRPVLEDFADTVRPVAASSESPTKNGTTDENPPNGTV